MESENTFTVNAVYSNISHPGYTTIAGSSLSTSERFDRLAYLYKKQGAKVLMLTECNPSSAASIASRMGASWRYGTSMVGQRMNSVLYDNSEFEMIREYDKIALPSPPRRQVRSVEIAMLRHRRTNKRCSFAVTHFSANKEFGSSVKGAYWRARQARYVASYLKEFDYFVLSMDANESSTAGGVRAIFSLAGITHMRKALSGVINSNWNSFAGGWDDSDQAKRGSWIDDMFVRTRRATGSPVRVVTLVTGGLVDTGKASDHNILWAKFFINATHQGEL